MKIILAHYKYFVQGGPERYMFKFTKLLQKMGHTVIPFSVNYEKNEETPYAKYFVAPNIGGDGNFAKAGLTPAAALRFARTQFHNKEAYRKLKLLIRDERPDLLYVLIPGMLTADIFKAAEEEQVPIILRLSDFRLICGNNILMRDGEICEDCIHGDYRCMVQHRCVKGSRLFSALRAAALSSARRHGAYDAVDAVITPPANTRNKLIEAGYFPADKVFVNSTFLDCSRIKPAAEHENYVLCLGRFSEEKGFIYAVEAMRYLRDLPVQIAITGDRDGCAPALRELIAREGLEDKVRFVGFLHGEALADITRRALCVACPAIWYENQPNVVIEAFAYGKPVVASDLGSLREMVEDGKTGLLFTPKDAKGLADCIRRLYEDPALYAAVSANARKQCETVYSPERHYETFMQVYETVCVRRQGAARLSEKGEERI